jgi:aminoglycoside 2''-phosphotransferase
VINDDVVFRFAKNEHAQTLLAYEAQLLHPIGRSVSVPVPRIEHCTASYMCYRIVPGSPLYCYGLLRADPATQDRLASELATFIHQLHAIPLSEVPLSPWQASAPFASCRTIYEQRLVDLEQDVYPLLWANQKAWISDLFAPVREGRVDLDAYAPVFIHRDLASYHIFYAGTLELE